MAYLRQKNVLVLLGPSGCGKTTFGRSQAARKYPSTMVLSTGLELVKRNKLNTPQKPDRKAIKELCHELINETFVEFEASKSRFLILDCVKDLEDAEYVTAEANKHGLEISQALLFHIDEALLAQFWQKCGTDKLREIFGSPQKYLYSWKVTSNDVINYYRNLKLLCDVSVPLSGTWVWWPGRYLCSRPNYLQFMLLDSAQIKNVFTMLHSILNVRRLQFTLPASFVHSDRDLRWVTNPTRYYVTVKADGVRCLLLKIQNGTYLITRKKEIYPCYIEDDQLPENTVLDGQLLPCTSISEIYGKILTPQLKTSVFLAFDVLALSGDVLWTWPLSVRLECFCKLPIRKDIMTVMKQATVDDDEFSAQEESNTGDKTLTIHCAAKGHRPSTPDDILKCLDAKFPYPCNGLIFTPDKAYFFGLDPLMFKWQSTDSIRCDLALTFSEDVLNKSEVYECRWNPRVNSWEPIFVRNDRAVPNSDKTIELLEKICELPYAMDIVFNLVQFSSLNGNEDMTESNEPPALGHPADSFTFDELSSSLNELVQLGEIMKTVHCTTNLEIFTYGATASPRNPMICLSRGLVLHPPSKIVVAKPFVRFFEDVGNRDPNEMVEATIKFDGSLGIAFLWNDEVMVTTRRRMDSEQAIWAKQWIKDHCNLKRFQMGYTYLFEIIYKNNTVVVNYQFEGLVLLAITTESGNELPYEKVLHLARAIGFFMVTPRVVGPYSEVSWYCGGIESNEDTSTPESPQLTSGALSVKENRQEGWVVKFKDGSRQKVIYKWWKDASKVAQIVHPQVVWLLIKHAKIAEVFRNVPHHLLVEILRMMYAIVRKFKETRELVEKRLRKPTQAISDEEDLIDYVSDIEEWWDNKDAMQDDVQTEESARKTNDEEENNKNLFELLLEKLKPYRHSTRLSCMHKQKQPTDVNITPLYNHEKRNFLRLPILNYIRPTSPALEGYEPSENFQQTWCKGWKTLPIDHWYFVQTVLQKNNNVPPLLQMPDEILVMILKWLDDACLTALAKVCVRLRQIAKSEVISRKQNRSNRDSDFGLDKWWHASRWGYESYCESLDIFDRYSLFGYAGSY